MGRVAISTLIVGGWLIAIGFVMVIASDLLMYYPILVAGAASMVGGFFICVGAGAAILFKKVRPPKT